MRRMLQSDCDTGGILVCNNYHISADDEINEEVRECNEYEANLTKAEGPKDDDKVANNDTSKGVKDYTGDYL